MKLDTGVPRLPGVFVASALVALWAGAVVAQSPPPILYAFEEVVGVDDEQRLVWPTAVASGRNDEIVVADAAGPSLSIFRNRGGGEGWAREAAIELPAPAFSLACGADRYLLSTRTPGILFEFQRPGFVLKELALPAGVVPGAVACLPDGGILVHDLAAGQLVSFGTSLEVRASVALPGAVAALAQGPGGGFYATLPQVGEVRRYAANGEELSAVSVPGLTPTPAWPVGLFVETDGEIVVVDRHGGRIVVIKTNGSWEGSGSRRGWEPGLLRFPADVARLPDGRIAVADLGNGRVQLFRRLEE
jgi:hypothetical protein